MTFLRAVFLSGLLTTTACSLERSADPEEKPKMTESFSLARFDNPAHIGVTTSVQAFWTMKQGAHCTPAGFEGEQCVPDVIMPPMPFTLTSITCPDGSCSIEKIHNWTRSSGCVVVDIVPRAETVRVHATLGDFEDEITFAATP